MKHILSRIILLQTVAICLAACTKGEQANTGGEIPYDEDCPAFYKARLIKPSENYRKSAWESYAVYGDLPIVRESEHRTGRNHRYDMMTIWRTKDATYLAIVYVMGWVRTFYSFSDDICLRDCDTGAHYQITEVMNFPFNQEYFVEGVPGDHIYMLLKFPPLPKSTRYIDYLESGNEAKRLSIKQLEASHHIIEPAERKIVY